MRKRTSIQKQRRVGHGPYSVKAPPSSKAAAKPIACAPIVIKAALFVRSGLVNSKIAAVDHERETTGGSFREFLRVVKVPHLVDLAKCGVLVGRLVLRQGHGSVLLS